MEAPTCAVLLKCCLRMTMAEVLAIILGHLRRLLSVCFVFWNGDEDACSYIRCSAMLCFDANSSRCYTFLQSNRWIRLATSITRMLCRSSLQRTRTSSHWRSGACMRCLRVRAWGRAISIDANQPSVAWQTPTLTRGGAIYDEPKIYIR